MTDTTAHNIGVIEKICEAINSEDFAQKLYHAIYIRSCCFKINSKNYTMIFSCLLVLKGFTNAFIVYIDFKNENFVLNAIKCLSNFVNEKKTVIAHGIDFPILPNSLLQF